MKIVCLEKGLMASNSYIIYDKNEGALIDTGVSKIEIIKELNNLNINLKYIILTHGHVDHIVNSLEIRNITGAQIVVHEDDVPILKDPNANYSSMGEKFIIEDVDITVKDGDKLVIGDEELKIIHTPGHTAGGICIKNGNDLFTGDTLFKKTVGRTDLISGSQKQLENSIKNILYKLPDEIVIYPGHGKFSTIGYEKKNNLFVKDE